MESFWFKISQKKRVTWISIMNLLLKSVQIFYMNVRGVRTRLRKIIIIQNLKVSKSSTLPSGNNKTFLHYLHFLPYFFSFHRRVYLLYDDDYVVIALPFDDVTDNLSLVLKKTWTCILEKRREWDRRQRDKRLRCVMKNSIGFAPFYCCFCRFQDLLE